MAIWSVVVRSGAAPKPVFIIGNGEGRNYTPAEYASWLKDTGFADTRTVWFEAPGANGAVTARKP